MKIYSQLVVLSAFQAWGAAAFGVPGPKILKPSSSVLHASSLPGSTSSAQAGWNLPGKVRIEGLTRKSFTFEDVSRETVQVVIDSNGRPMNGDIELWIGPDWTPCTVKCYSENGMTFPVHTLMGTRNKVATVEIRNTSPFELPLNAAAAYAVPPLSDIRSTIPNTTEGRYIEGGAVYSVPFESSVNKVQVLLKTDSRQLNAKIELLNGPNNVKQTYEVFTNNGMLNSLYVVLSTPGSGNTVRIRNLASVEFPCRAHVTPA